MTKEETIKSIKTIQDFANLLNSKDINLQETWKIIEEKGWYDLTIEDCLNEECTLHTICSDGQFLAIYNSETDVVFVEPDKVREKQKEVEPLVKTKETGVNFKSVTGHDICVRVKRVSEVGSDKSFIEMSIDGGEFYKNVGASTYGGQVYYMVHDKEQDKTLRVIIPDDVYCEIMYLRAEKIVKTKGSLDDLQVARVKEYIANGWVLPKANIKKCSDEAGMKDVFHFWNNYESDMDMNEVFDILAGVYARGLNDNYRGYMIAEYVDVIKRVYPNEF